MQKTTYVNIRISQDYKDKIQKMADKEHLPLSTYLRKLICTFIDKKKLSVL